MNRTQLNAYIAQRIAENNSNAITPAKHREVEFAILDYVDQTIEAVEAAAQDAVSFQGVFSSLNDLNSGVENPQAGDYAQVLTGGQLQGYSYNATTETWETSTFSPLIISIKLVLFQELVDNNQLVPGTKYKVFMPSDLERGVGINPGGLAYIYCEALNGNTVTKACVGAFNVFDWATIGENVFGLARYNNVEQLTGVEPAVNMGPYQNAAAGGDWGNGNFVFHEGFVYQVTDLGSISGDLPSDNPEAFTLLPKSEIEGNSYVIEHDFVLWDGYNDWVLERRDKRGNTAQANGKPTQDKMNLFAWGNENSRGNFMAANSLVWNSNDVNSYVANSYFLGSIYFNQPINFPVDNCLFEALEGFSITPLEGSMFGCKMVAATGDFSIEGSHYAKQLDPKGSNFEVEIDVQGNTTIDFQLKNWAGIYILTDSDGSANGVVRKINNGPEFEFEIRPKEGAYIQISDYSDIINEGVEEGIYSKRLPLILENLGDFVRLKRYNNTYYQLISCHDDGIIQPQVNKIFFTGQYFDGKPIFEYNELKDIPTLTNFFFCAQGVDEADGLFDRVIETQVNLVSGYNVNTSPSLVAYTGPANISAIVNSYVPANGAFNLIHNIQGQVFVKIRFTKLI